MWGEKVVGTASVWAEVLFGCWFDLGGRRERASGVGKTNRRFMLQEGGGGGGAEQWKKG